MFSVEENERLVRVGAGTPVGEVLRRFWMPFLPSSDLEAEGSPVRVRLLGEDLVAFRNRDGEVGIVDRWCPHRGIDLFFGRNEECGLRCIYHGWKVEIDGRVSEMPNIPSTGPLGDRVRTVAYPSYDDGTVLWAYLGPPEDRPARPPVMWEDTPSERVSARRTDCHGNWFQHLEGQVDSSHVAFLHNYVSKGEHLFGDEAAYLDRNPGLMLDDTEYGTMVGWLRKGRGGTQNVRMTQWAVPFMTGIAGFLVEGNNQFHFAVPIDDESTMYFVVDDHPVATPAEAYDTDEARALRAAEYRPGTYQLVAGLENDYFIDRHMQKHENFSGITSIRVQDLAVQERVRGGSVADRSSERLVASDRAIIHARRRILDLADRLEAGEKLTEPSALATMRFRPFDRDIDPALDVTEYSRDDLAQLNAGQNV